jgi:hypothetical protein
VLKSTPEKGKPPPEGAVCLLSSMDLTMTGGIGIRNARSDLLLDPRGVRISFVLNWLSAGAAFF